MGSLTKATTETFGTGGVNSTNIQNEAITNAKIASDAAIANSKLAITFPTISSLSITNGQPAVYDTETVDINGTDFTNGARVDFIHSTTNAVINLPTVTFVSATQLRVTIPASTLTEGTDYKIRVSNPDGLAATSIGTVLYSETVSFSTSSGSLGSVGEGESASFSVSASSNSAISYSVTSGSLPTGLSLNSSTGAITGTAPSVAADTTSTFTITATDAESQTASRSFSITVTNFVIDNSLRFNDNDSAYLTRSTGTTNKRTFTVSVWVKRTTLNARQTIWASDQNTNDTGDGSKGGSGNYISFWNNGEFYFGGFGGSFQVRADGLQRDVSAWYHIVAQTDTTQATTNDRGKLWINGVQQTTYTSMIGQNTDVKWATNRIGVRSDVANYSDSVNLTAYADGYIAELHVVDGQALTASDFGETDSTTGAWVPKKYTGTYGTDGYYLDFSNSADLGNDSSGNNNDFTPSNLAATDQTSDTPTNNFCTLNPLSNAMGGTLSEGNLQIVSSGSDKHCFSTFGLTSGKWYFEVKDISQGGQFKVFALTDADHNDTTPGTNQCHIIFSTGETSTSGTANSNAGAMTTGDILAVAINLDDGEVYFTKNGNIDTGLTAQATGISISGRKRDFRISAFESGSPTTAGFNFGNPSFSISSGNSDENGYGNFEYAPPSGYLALCTNNLPEPTIKDSGDYFNTVLYTGNNVDDRSITGVGFQPDFMWSKERTSTGNHILVDSSRGATKVLQGNLTNGEATVADGFQAFESDGFQVGAANSTNETGVDYVNWCWKINGGTETTNNDGTIESYVQTNTTAGISIAEYQGNGSNGATFGHGLGSVPDLSIYKCREQSTDWAVWPRAHNPGGTNAARLNSNAAFGGANGAGFFNDVAPTSSVITLGTRNEINQSSQNYVSYHFKSIPGFSKFGTYTGNGSADGPFLYFGFNPMFVIIKRMDSTGSWFLIDAVRDIDVLGAANTKGSADSQHRQLFAEAVDVESTYNSTAGDFLSNGYKLRATSASTNASGGTYIYIAFAEAPFGGILTNEATAR